MNKGDNEIHLMELFHKLLKYKKIFLISIIVFYLMGLLIANLTPKQYTASSTFISKGLQSDRVSLPFYTTGGDSKGVITPSMYPMIISSITFQKEIINTPLQLSFQKEPITYAEYYQNYTPVNKLAVLKKYTIYLPFTVFNGIKSLFAGKETSKPQVKPNNSDNQQEFKNLYSITASEQGLFSILNDQLSLSVDSKKSTITISCTMPEAIPAAQMTEKAQELLQHLITDYRVKQLKEQLHFIEEQYQSSKELFEQKQYALASYQDKNRDLSTRLAQTHLEKLKSEYDLAFSIYSNFAKQLESKKIQIQEDAPVFINIDPVVIPLSPSEPQKSKIITKWVIIGFILTIITIVIYEFRKKFKEYIKNLN